MLSSSFRQGTPPDIFLVSSTWFSEYASLFVDAPEAFLLGRVSHCFFPFRVMRFERNGVMKEFPFSLMPLFLLSIVRFLQMIVLPSPENRKQIGEDFGKPRKFSEIYRKNNMTFASFPLQEDSPLFSLFLFHFSHKQKQMRKIFTKADSKFFNFSM